MTWRAGLITGLAIAFVTRLTLTSAHQDPDAIRAGFTCMFECNNEGARDVLSNILLFIPLGWALSYWVKPGTAILLCVIATVTIETLQGTVLVGRDSSLRDILSNSAGGGLGVWLFRDWRSLIWPRTRGSLMLGSLAALAAGAVLVVSGLATGLAPSSNVWFGLWAREYGLYTQYLGKILTIESDQNAMPAGELPEPIRLREDMRTDSFLVHTRVVSGPQPAWSASIFSIVDKAHDEQMVIAQDRHALIFQVRTRYEKWEFRPIIAKLTMFPGRSPGDTVTIEAGRSRSELFLHASTDKAQAEVRLPLTVGLGWAGMLPFRYAIQDEWMLMNPLWLAGLIFPLAYWFGRASPTSGAAGIGALIAVGLWLIPLMTGAAPTAAVEWIGSVCGSMAGWGLGVRSRHHDGLSNGKDRESAAPIP